MYAKIRPGVSIAFFGRMSFLSDPRIGKFVTGATAVLVLVAVAVLLMVGVVLYGSVSAGTPRTQIAPASLPGNPSLVDIAGPGIEPRQGIFFPGQTSAPTIILAHGYRSSRDDLLTLAIALQENKYNVFLFDFSGHGEMKGMVTLGYRETRELLAAIEAVAQRPDVDNTRFGIYGMDMGGYAALAAAAGDGRVRAVAVDSAYGSPREMLILQVQRSGVAGVPLMETFCRWGFGLLTLSYRNDPPVSQSVAGLAGVPKLFIQSREKPVLAEKTLELFQASTGVREQALVAKSNFAGMTEEEKRAYEVQIVNFFLQNLPPLPPKPAR